MASGGRKDAFPGADGSTIQQTGSPNAEAIQIYDDKENPLTEGSETGLQFVNITANGVLNEKTSQVYTIKQPLTYIYCSNTTPWDWYTNNAIYQNNDLWSLNKTVYDPCPKGWKVPQDGTWNDCTTVTFPYYIHGQQTTTGSRYTTNGRQYVNLTWYPAAGFRDFGNGKLSFIGCDGSYWSSTYSNVRARYLYYPMTYVGPNNAYYRVMGFSVRCVQE